jgi:hypothetical protein
MESDRAGCELKSINAKKDAGRGGSTWRLCDDGKIKWKARDKWAFIATERLTATRGTSC